jgi:hypothetical protein
MIRRLALLVALTLSAALPLAARTYSLGHQGLVGADFRAFYCGAQMTNAGQDPYTSQAIGACENMPAAPWLYPRDAGLILPAPLPGYDFALLAPLAHLPYAIALDLWVLLSAAAIALSVVALAKITRFEGSLIFAALALPVAVESLPSGELVPLTLAAICGAAYFLQRERWVAAGACAAATMIEPHLGLPLCAAMFTLVPRVRVALLSGAAVFAALSLAVVGRAGIVGYFSTVLPQHALSEVEADFQYSLTVVLHALGMSAGAAVRAGELFYFAMLAFGIVAAASLARKTNMPAVIALLPPALAVIGGPFIHLTQIAVAIPVLLLFAAVSDRARFWLLPSILLLAIPWMVVQNGNILLASLFPATFIAWRLSGRSLATSGLALCAVTTLAFSIFLSVGDFSTAPPREPVTPVAARSLPAGELAEASWKGVVREVSTGAMVTWMIRIPTWVGLLGLLAYVCIAASTRSRRVEVAPAASIPVRAVRGTIEASLGGTAVEYGPGVTPSKEF